MSLFLASKEYRTNDMHYFATVFDNGFLSRALALYHSVAERSLLQYEWWMICMDDEAYEILEKLSLPHVVLVRRDEFEDETLRNVQRTRSQSEYFWTLSAVSTHYVLSKNPQAETVAYLDADLFFYAPIDPIFEAFNGHSTLIIPHHCFGRDAAVVEEKFGTYNVGLLIFRNDADGRACLTWWKERCIEWCYDRQEPTRWGDQKYLDYFEKKFRGVYVLLWKGANAGRWNIGAYQGVISMKNGKVYLGNDLLYFFHFSQFKLYYPPSSWLPSGPASFPWGRPSPYTMPSLEKHFIYDPYREAFYVAMREIQTVYPSFGYGMLPRPFFLTTLLAQGIQYIRYFFERKKKEPLVG